MPQLQPFVEASELEVSKFRLICQGRRYFYSRRQADVEAGRDVHTEGLYVIHIAFRKWKKMVINCSCICFAQL